MSVTDIYLKFASEAEARQVASQIVRENPISSKRVAEDIARQKLAIAYKKFADVAFTKDVIVKETAILEESKATLEVSKIEGYVKEELVTREDLNLKVEEAELPEDWILDSTPPDGRLGNNRFDIVVVGTVYDINDIFSETPEAVARDGYHVIVRIRGNEPVPDLLKTYETKPWNQVLG